MEHFKFSIDNEIIILEKYNLTPTELFTVKTILLAKEEGEYEWLQRLSKVVNLRKVIETLQEKGIILKSWKLPKEGTQLIVADIPINQNFQKQFFRASFEMGEELFDVYPQTLIISGIAYNAKRVSKKFDSLEQAFSKYAKYIRNDPETHREILELIEWGKENQYNFTTLDSFIVDMGWIALKAQKEGIGTNINLEATQLI